jgi:hypothetical protein
MEQARLDELAQQVVEVDAELAKDLIAVLHALHGIDETIPSGKRLNALSAALRAALVDSLPSAAP